jgi:hypothetical protein
MKFKNSILTISLCLITFSVATASDKPRHLPRLSLDEVTSKIPCTLDQCPRLIKRHLIRDIKGCQLDPADVARAPELMREAGLMNKKVRGANLYLSFVPGSYSYDATLDDDGGITINSKVYFNNPKKISPEDRASMREKLTMAALKWQSSNPYNFPLRFNFDVTDSRKEGDVSARLTDDDTRGPYFHEWTTAWGHHTVAHEMGHVMGLDDEYSNTFGAIREALTYCSRTSMMCGSIGAAQPYHYYMIVRRLLCRLKV